MKRLGLVICGCVFYLTMWGCASINYNEIAPNAKSFKPKVAVLLPAIKMPEGTDQEAEKVAKAIYAAAMGTKRFEKIIDPMAAKSQMADNSELQNAIMGYTSKLRSLGVSDKESGLKIGEIYQVDTIIVGEAGKWGYSTIAGEKAGDVAIALKMVDAATGSIYWKASHTARKTYSLFKPDLGDMAIDLCKKIFDFMPKP